MSSTERVINLFSIWSYFISFSLLCYLAGSMRQSKFTSYPLTCQSTVWKLCRYFYFKPVFIMCLPVVCCITNRYTQYNLCQIKFCLWKVFCSLKAIHLIIFPIASVLNEVSSKDDIEWKWWSFRLEICIYGKYWMIKLSDSQLHLHSRRHKTSVESWA